MHRSFLGSGFIPVSLQSPHFTCRRRVFCLREFAMPSTSGSTSSTSSSRDRRRKGGGRERIRRDRRSPSPERSKKGRAARADSPRRRGARGRSPASLRSRSNHTATEKGSSHSPPRRSPSTRPLPGTVVTGGSTIPEPGGSAFEFTPASLSSAIHLAHAELGELERKAGIATPVGVDVPSTATSSAPAAGGAPAGAAPVQPVAPSLQPPGTLMGLKLPPGNRYGSYLFAPAQLKGMEEAGFLAPGHFIRAWLSPQALLPLGDKEGPAIFYICRSWQSPHGGLDLEVYVLHTANSAMRAALSRLMPLTSVMDHSKPKTLVHLCPKATCVSLAHPSDPSAPLGRIHVAAVQQVFRAELAERSVAASLTKLEKELARPDTLLPPMAQMHRATLPPTDSSRVKALVMEVGPSGDGTALPGRLADEPVPPALVPPRVSPRDGPPTGGGPPPDEPTPAALQSELRQQLKEIRRERFDMQELQVQLRAEQARARDAVKVDVDAAYARGLREGLSRGPPEVPHRAPVQDQPDWHRPEAADHQRRDDKERKRSKLSRRDARGETVRGTQIASAKRTAGAPGLHGLNALISVNGTA